MVANDSVGSIHFNPCSTAMEFLTNNPWLSSCYTKTLSPNQIYLDWLMFFTSTIIGLKVDTPAVMDVSEPECLRCSSRFVVSSGFTNFTKDLLTRC
jgi:hypothetical protein